MKFTSPGAEDIIFEAICVNISQEKWKFLDQISSRLTTSLCSRAPQLSTAATFRGLPCRRCFLLTIILLYSDSHETLMMHCV